MSKKQEYHKPPHHIQVGEIANTPIWLREHFKEKERKRILDLIENFETEKVRWGVGDMLILKKDWKKFILKIKGGN